MRFPFVCGWLAVLLALMWLPVSGQPARPLDRVRLQLKWKHQFQFAGYYAAIAQGYYRDAGLEVELQEAQPGHDPVETVLRGEAEFGVGTSELLLLRGRGQPVVVLGVVYQHSPLVLLARKTPGVSDLQDLHRLPMMIEPQSAELFAYLRNEGIDPAKLDIRHHTFEVRDLIDGKIAAMTAYATDEPFLLDEAGVDHLIFTPRAGGIDFYGDNLFTTERQVRDHPERVKALRAASLRGWEYALAHPEEIVDVIRKRYSTRKSREHLLFEARQTVQLVHPELIEVGHMYSGRWRHIADTYAEFGMLPRGFGLQGFLYDPDPRPDMRWAYWTLGLLAAGVAALTLWILPLVRLNRQLRQAKEAAEAAHAAKSGYLAFLAHEIRTPLYGLIGVIETMKDGKSGEDQRESVELLDRSSQHLLQLIDSVLDHAKIEAGRMEIELGPCALTEFLGGIVDLFAPAAQAKGLKLRLDLASDLPAVVQTDATRLRQILSNLVSNAVKFTATGEVVLTARTGAGPNRLRLEVRDTGIGIAADAQARIFEPYWQADPSVSRRFGGTGLGLNISRRLAQLLGGDITVRSAPGQGSTFAVEILADPVPGDLRTAI